MNSKKKKEEKEKEKEKEKENPHTRMKNHSIERPSQESDQKIFTNKQKYQKKHIHNFNKIFTYM